MYSWMVKRMNSKNCNAMKNIFSKIMLFAVAATALVSCAKDTENTPIDNKEKLIELTLKADKPATVRTELIEGVPYWSADDAVGVYLTDTSKNYKFTNDSEEATLITTFTGQTAVTDTLYPYYPYTSNGASENGAKVDIPVNQNPTATSFDGAADIMIAKPITLDAEGTQLENLEFARVGAIVKIVLKDNTSSLAAQHISSLTMTADSNLVGRVYLDVINQQLGELYSKQSPKVTATYTEDTQFVVNGENAVYVIVYPQTLVAGTTLNFKASTEGYAIDKTITLPNDIALEMGKVTTLNVSLTAEHITAEESGLALPFEDDFSWVGETSTTAFSSITNKFPTRDDVAMYYAVAYTYPEDNTALKFSSSKNQGTLTTSELNLSQPFSVVVNAKQYSNTEKSMTISVGETSETITLTADYADYVIEFDAASAKEKITITNSKRFYLNDLKVVAGHDYVLPPVLSVTPETLAFNAEGGNQTVTCTIENEVAGVDVTATEDVDWLTTSVDGTTVTISATKNTGNARNAKVTIAYEGAESKTVTVTQAAVGGGGVTKDATFAPRKVTETNTTFTDDQGNNWTFTSDAAGFTSSTSYVHAGSNSKAVSHITFESTIENVTSVTVNAAAKNNTNVTIKVYIGSTLIGTSNVLGATQNDGGTAFTVENTQNATGALKIVVSRPSSVKGAIYFNQAVVNYTN